MRKIVCSCCGCQYDIKDDLLFVYSICPKCYWEEDPNVSSVEDYSTVNSSSIKDNRLILGLSV